MQHVFSSSSTVPARPMLRWNGSESAQAMVTWYLARLSQIPQQAFYQELLLLIKVDWINLKGSLFSCSIIPLKIDLLLALLLKLTTENVLYWPWRSALRSHEVKPPGTTSPFSFNLFFPLFSLLSVFFFSFCFSKCQHFSGERGRANYLGENLLSISFFPQALEGSTSELSWRVIQHS